MGTANVYIDALPIVIEGAHRVVYLPDGSQHVLDEYDRPLFSSGPSSHVCIVMQYSSGEAAVNQVAPFATMKPKDDVKQAVDHQNRIKEAQQSQPDSSTVETQQMPRFEPPMSPSLTPVPRPLSEKHGTQQPAHRTKNETPPKRKRHRAREAGVMYVKKENEDTQEVVLPPDFLQSPTERVSGSGSTTHRPSE